jgi:heme ABC exporter ATP-binding subunit CcmA
MIEITKLVKKFGRRRILDDLELRVGKGELLAIFGPNGSGKTTLLKLLSTLIKPTSGSVTMNGQDLRENGVELRKTIGLLGHDTFLYEELSAKENLRFYMRLYRIPFTKAKEKEIERQLENVGLYHRMNDRVGTFSRGMKQRLSILRASVHEPSILLLDEPYTGLDKKGSEMLDGMLRAFHEQGKTIMMTTHDIEKGYNIAERVGILVAGRIVFDAPKDKVGLDGLLTEYGRLVEAA